MNDAQMLADYIRRIENVGPGPKFDPIYNQPPVSPGFSAAPTFGFSQSNNGENLRVGGGRAQYGVPIGQGLFSVGINPYYESYSNPYVKEAKKGIGGADLTYSLPDRSIGLNYQQQRPMMPNQPMGHSFSLGYTQKF